jgi:phosphoglycerate dehydrogenase-like enzyme
MKLLLHYRAGANLRAMLDGLPARLTVAVVEPGDHEGLLRELRDTEILLHVLAPVTAAMIDAAPRLKLIQKIGVGVDAIDVDHARQRGVTVCNMPGTNTAAVAEMTLALMLACLRRLPTMTRGMRDGSSWEHSGAMGDGLGEIGGRTVGLVGFGAVPQRLVPALEALGARIVATSRRQRADIDFMPLDELLGSADIVSLHLPATAETHRILDAGRIAMMKPGAILINTARGRLVDEAALTAALASGRLAAAGLDVFMTEPVPAENPLLRLPNVVATPHVAWLTRETLRRSLDVALENAARLAAGRPLLHVI